ncbi:hypothetical protein DIPPA_02532 [Diplonema papillatum]|nr:hypothetical protein DIPPA_02532 [Diplonema papillatum]
MSSAMVERAVRNLSTSRRTTERELARKGEYYASLEMRECTFAPNAAPSKPEPALAAGAGTPRHKLDGGAAAHRLFLEANQRAGKSGRPTPRTPSVCS